MRRDPGQGRGAQRGGVRHQFVHQAELQRFMRVEQLAFQNIGLRAHQAEQPRHLGDAAGAGNQAQRDFGQAELDFFVINRDAVMADQCHFPATPQRRTVEAADHRLAEGFQRTEVLLGLLNFLEDLGRIRSLQPHRGLEVGTGKKGAFVRRQHDAANRVLVFHDLRGGFGQVFLPLRAHGVDR